MIPEELDRLFSVIHAPRDQAIFRVAYHRGLRASELGLLRLEDYRPKAKRLLVHRLKKSHGGEYGLCAREVKALNAWLAIRGTRPGPLFPSRLGRPIGRAMLHVLMRQYGAAAGIPEEKRHMHCLKHSCATHLFERGEGVEYVQDHLGHAKIDNTLIYAKITNRRRDEAADRLRNW